RKQHEHGDVHVLRRHARERRVLSRSQQDCFYLPNQWYENRGDQDRRPKALTDGAANILDLARAKGLRGERSYGGYDAASKQQEGREKRSGQCAGGQIVGTEPAHHYDVCGEKRVLCDLRYNERPSEFECRCKFPAPALGRTVLDVCCHWFGLPQATVCPPEILASQTGYMGIA